ncbi:MAG: hypothetical protein ABF968_04910 [Acetobacter sp.]|uniref:hypothetical protein n=1 Tax=Acetobacter sp. TaxID=440 RepID=UPI0039E9FD03
MNAITTNAAPMRFFQPSSDLLAVAEVLSSGTQLCRRDLTPSRVSEARAMLETADLMLAPPSPVLVVAWLKKLAPLVKNAPSTQGEAERYSRQIVDVCDDIPAAAFNEEARKAWVKQGDKGVWWPAVAELYAHLKPFGERAKRQISGARRIVAATERKDAEPARRKPSPEERAAVAAQLEALRAEQAQQKALDEAIAEFGSWTPDGAENLSGDALADFLEGVIPSLDGLKRKVTEMRVEELRISAAMMRQVLAMSEGAEA